MLTHLSIRNFLLIEKLDLEVPPGLLVLSGETGAGKSILLDSLSMALGARSDIGLVRAGADQASVTLSFQLPSSHPVREILEDMDWEEEDGQLLLRRVIGKDGRSKAFVNDQPVAVNALRQMGEALFDIHSQFETHGLLNRETHLALLDQYAGCEEEARELGATFTVWKEAEKTLEAARGNAADAQRRADDIRAALDELEKLKPEANEAEALAEKRTRLQQKERIMEALKAASDGLQQDEGACSKTAHVRRVLSRAAEKAPDILNPTLEALSRAEDALAEATQMLDSLLHNDDFDVNALEKAEERLFALRAAARKYQCTPEDLPELLARFAQQAQMIEDGAGSLKKLEEQTKRVFEMWSGLATQLHEKREKASKKLEAAVQKELPPLKLEKARLSIQVEKLSAEQAGITGLSRVTFLAAMNPGAAPSPLHKTASGGELARFMLALRLCLSAASDTTTLIFDEVDTGVGGATAHAVGERLALLAGKTQTLVITHSPQVAARGHYHWRVEKTLSASSASTKVKILEGDERREEIARMLSGSSITEAARQTADHLLAGEDEGAPKKKRKAS
jgi:DNA repair protein RecN (Recombination protein N)